MLMLKRQNSKDCIEWLNTAGSEGAAVLIDKELRWTSFDVVAKLRTVLRIKKIGHAGTLDPLASGLLIVCCGKATKSIESFQDMPKEYLAEIRLGAVTETYDSEKPEEQLCDVSHLQEEGIQEALRAFVGEIDQIPPMYSARKVSGKRLYELARKGQEIERPSRRVQIHELIVEDYTTPLLRVRVRCSKGTYVRSLAHDLGQALGCGGYLSSLRRTKIGEYSVDDALTIAELSDAFHPKPFSQNDADVVSA